MVKYIDCEVIEKFIIECPDDAEFFCKYGKRKETKY